MDKSAEQQARDMLERMGVEDAQSFSSGDVVELANLIVENHKWRQGLRVTLKADIDMYTDLVRLKRNLLDTMPQND